MQPKTEKADLQELVQLARVLLRVRQSMIRQLDTGGFSDAFVEKQLKDADSRKSAVMPLAYGAEAVVLPLGVLSEVANKLAERGYARAREFFVQDPDLRMFSVDILRNIQQELSSLQKLFTLAYPRLTSTLNDPSADALAPYGRHDCLDLQAWRLAALVDLDDLFFVTNPLDPTIESSQLALHAEFTKVLEPCIYRTADILILNNYPETTNLRGWYGRIDLMDGINEFAGKRALELKRKLQFETPTPRDTGGWMKFIQKFIDHPTVIETTIVSTRAIMAVLTVAQAVYRDWAAAPKRSWDNAFKDTLRRLAERFQEIENGVFRHDTFATFVLQEFKRITSHDVLAQGDYDRFIHTAGILSFALTRGYFCDAGEHERFRESVRTATTYDDRSAVIADVLRHLEKGDTRAILLAEGGLLEQQTWFVATSDPSVLFDVKTGEELPLGTPTERERLGLDHAFPFTLGIPLLVKSLAQLAFDERLSRMRAHPPSEWGEIAWPSWLERIERVCKDFADHMIRRQLRDDGHGGLEGVFAGEDDLSTTAAVVDAMTLWSADLMCRAALYRQFDIEEAPPPPAVPSLSDDYRVVADFFQLLSKYTGGPGSSVGSDRGTGLEEGLAEWLDVFWRTLRECYAFCGNDYNWDNPTETERWQPPKFEDVLRLVALIRHIQRGVEGEEKKREAAESVLSQMRRLLVQGAGKVPFGSSFHSLLGRVQKEYPDAFKPGAAARQIDGAQVV